MYINLCELHSADKMQDTTACHLVCPKDIAGTVCTVWTYCGFSNGHEEINTSNYG